MPLLEELPEQVENRLVEIRAQADREQQSESDAAEETESVEPLKQVAFATDIAADGSWGEEWLVVDDRSVYVFAPNGGNKADLRLSVPIKRIKEATTEILVGNGQIEVRTDEDTIQLVRFSQAVMGEAHAVTRQINARSKGEAAFAEHVEESKKRCPRCKRVLPPDSAVCPACVNTRAVMLRLFKFLAPYKKWVAGSILVILGMTLMDLAPPYIGGRIVDTIAGRHGPPGPDAFGKLLGYVGILACARIGFSVLQYGQRRINSYLGARTLMDIRIELYAKFTEFSLAYYDKRSTGSVMSRITNDADNLWDFLAEGLPWLVSNVLQLLAIGIVLFRMNWHLALLLLTPGPAIFGLTRWFMPRAHRRWHFVWHRISKMYSALNSSLNGMRVIKAFHQEGREGDRFRERNRKVFEASFAANSMWATYWPLMGMLMALGSWIIWIAGGYQVLRGVMTIGTLTAFNGYLWQFYAPFQNFSRVMDWTTRSMTAAERVFEVLDTQPDVTEDTEPVSVPDLKGAVEFDRVSFSYDKGKRALEDFTLKVEPGEMIGLVGRSGAGKSTIINLLARFYDVQEGSVKIDGVDVRKLHQDDFRGQLGIVLQEPFLFPGTIRDNIAYANPSASIEEIMQSAKAANCHEFILKFPDGYDTQVGERGQRLSGGERQRISIARAILHNPKILILDEATASVDTETEKQIQEAIARLITGRTTFAIAHRLSTLRNASRLAVVKEGKLAELGTHDELMEQDGVYANLVKIQTEVNKIRAV
jgi:ATP-binding cassette subfamily B protein